MSYFLSEWMDETDFVAQLVFNRKSTGDYKIPDNLRRVVSMAENGYSATEIAEEADGIDVTTVRHWLVAAGQRVRAQFAEKPGLVKRVLDEYYFSEQSQADVAEELGVKKQYVNWIVSWPVRRFELKSQGVELSDNPTVGSPSNRGGRGAGGTATADDLPPRLK